MMDWACKKISINRDSYRDATIEFLKSRKITIAYIITLSISVGHNELTDSAKCGKSA